MQCDGAIRNIEKEILRECANRGIQVHNNFLNYYIKLLALDPSWGISTTSILNRADVQNFIKFVVRKLDDQFTPSIITLKMQFYFNCNFQSRQKMVKRNRMELLARLKALEHEIVDVKQVIEDEEIDLMYKKMVFYITLASGMGNPTIDSVFKEVRTALGSILDANEMTEFCKHPRYVKIENLQEFTKLVTGIRLFNKDCGKGGEGMEELPKLIDEALDATTAELQSHLIGIMDKVNLMTTALDFVHGTDIDERGRYVIVYNLPKDVTMADVEYVKDSLIVYRQFELYLRKLLDEVDKMGTMSHLIFQNLQTALMHLHDVVKHRIAIPVNEVFPHFVKLSDIWCSLQDQTVLLAKLNQILTTLQKYLKVLSFNEAIAEMMIPFGESAMTDAQRLERTLDAQIPQKDNKAKMLDVTMFRDIDSIKLEYLGFCAWKLVTTEGALLPGNPNLGVAEVMNMHFVFSTVDAGVAFGKNPQKYIMELINLARRKPELINLLQIRKKLILVQNIKELVREPPLLPLTEEVEVQTEIHPVDKNIDNNYSWNVWEHRRKAIQLAGLQHCVTRSGQTQKTYYRFGMKTQTYERRDKECQTMSDNYTNVPRPANYIFGLRGRKDDKQFVVDLTRPVDK